MWGSSLTPFDIRGPGHTSHSSLIVVLSFTKIYVFLL